MDAKRYFELQNNPDLDLTEEEQKEWHFCMDWDGLLIHMNDPEMSCCTCWKAPSA